MTSRNYSFELTRKPKESERVKYIIYVMKDNKYHGYVELTSPTRETGVRGMIGDGEYFGRIKESREETILYYKQLGESYTEYGGHYSSGMRYNIEEIFKLLYQEGLSGVREKYAAFYQDHKPLLELQYDMYMVYKSSGRTIPKLASLVTL